MSYEHRIRCKALLDKVVTAEEAAKMIKDGDTIGCSGFTPSGYPKAGRPAQREAWRHLIVIHYPVPADSHSPLLSDPMCPAVQHMLQTPC